MHILERLKLKDQSYHVFTVYPDLKKACDMAVDFVGERFPGGSGTALVDDMLRAAFDEFKSASKGDQNPRHAFIQGLCSKAIGLFEVRYCAGSGANVKVWTPMTRAVTAFEAENETIFVEQEPDPQAVSVSGAARQFAARVLPSNLFLEVFINAEVIKRERHDNEARSEVR